jgi:RNA polymerase sigma factor (sigma-70 family)
MAKQARSERRLSPEVRGQAEAHVHLVDLLAREQYFLCGQLMPLDELLGEAQLALVYAASLYDAARNVPFGAYATLVVRHRLIQAVTVWRRFGRLDHVRFTDLPPTEDAAPFDPVCHRTRESYREAGDRELLERVRRVLPPRWFEVMRLYFAEGRTMEEIGRLLGISRQRVEQLLSKAIDRARRRCRREVEEG